MPNIFQRKVIPLGDGGLVVTLPISWARYYGIEPGDTVEVITNGVLTVRPPVKDAPGAEEEPASRKRGE